MDSYISTGIPSLDQMMGGGLLPGEIVEFYGENASGKSQVCMYLASTICKDAHVLYFDCKNDFSASRAMQFGNCSEDDLERITVYRTQKFEAIMQKLNELFIVEPSSHTYRLLIVDCVPLLFYPAITGKHMWKVCTDQLLNLLEKVSNRHGLTSILVNHATSSFSVPGSVKPALGKHYNERIKISLLFSKNNDDGIFKIVKEKGKPESSISSFYFIFDKTNKIITF